MRCCFNDIADGFRPSYKSSSTCKGEQCILKIRILVKLYNEGVLVVFKLQYKDTFIISLHKKRAEYHLQA